jgi:glycine/D-amino acid oxidase-like deaminating enzyme
MLATMGHTVHRRSQRDLGTRYPYLRPEGLEVIFEVDAGGVLLARAIVEHLAGYLTRMGAQLRTPGAVSSIDPSRPAVTLEDGRIDAADVVVVAAGPWVGRLLPGLNHRVTPSHQLVAYLEPPDAYQGAWKTAPMVLDIGGEAGFYLVPPVGGTALKIGDHRFTLCGLPDEPRSPDPDDVQALIELARPRLVAFESYRLLEARTCFYTVEPDETFIIEPMERAWVMTGFSGHGFKFGPLLGERLVETILSGSDPATLSSWAAGWDPALPGGDPELSVAPTPPVGGHRTGGSVTDE